MEKTEEKESQEPEEPFVMYIVVNNDLGMGKGKIASQVGHVVGLITEDIIRSAYECDDVSNNIDYMNYMKWKKGCAKIVLKASEQEILKIIAGESKARCIMDAGRTQIAKNSLTVLGFFPRNDLREKMKSYKLL
ncbi:MAG: putative peptidyl-tRNA hydrolase 2, mitochondrial-like [Dasosvirus sp.]|uniref:peptidyl-tRNA hydrolase n=1 Tax=Dasosvirus sp. TaxID=2487764 RepID=A0A3G4ZTY6_9VIRU|nr:MAG: putative peptidyl-tRNA hydrolase 2, mitochondrial-like [Dasosvirus sp.]